MRKNRPRIEWSSSSFSCRPDFRPRINFGIKNPRNYQGNEQILKYQNWIGQHITERENNFSRFHLLNLLTHHNLQHDSPNLSVIIIIRIPHVESSVAIMRARWQLCTYVLYCHPPSLLVAGMLHFDFLCHLSTHLFFSLSLSFFLRSSEFLVLNFDQKKNIWKIAPSVRPSACPPLLFPFIPIVTSLSSEQEPDGRMRTNKNLL